MNILEELTLGIPRELFKWLFSNTIIKEFNLWRKQANMNPS